MSEDSSQIKVPILYAFARSGGTLMNRCLGCIPGNIVLSEVNPHAALIPVEVQAHDWFNLLSSSDLLEFKQKTYADKIVSLAKVAQQKNKHLIIRDWTTINFLNEASNDTYVPTMVLEQEIYLSYYGLACCPVVLTRRSADVYESITRTFKHLRNLSVKEFGSCYLSYAQAVSAYPVFHYEYFCREPETELKRMCDVLCVNYSDTFVTEFSHFTKCTGDNTLSQSSRGSRLEKITVLKSHQEAESYIAASFDINCLQADKLLGYETMEIEKQVDNLWKIVDFRDQALTRANDLKQQTQAELKRSQAQLQQTQAQLDQANAEFQAELERSQAQLQQTQAQLDQANAEFQAELERSQAQLQQTQAQLDQANAEFQAELERSQAQLQQTQAQLQQTQAELEHSRTIIQAMESSKFWKIRNGWLNLKQLLMLPTNN